MYRLDLIKFVVSEQKLIKHLLIWPYVKPCGVVVVFRGLM